MNKSLIFLLDVSSSMLDFGRDAALYSAMGRLTFEVFPNVTPPEDLDLTVRILAFGNEKITWVYGDQDVGVPYRNFDWKAAQGSMPGFAGNTPLGAAIDEVVNTLYYGESLSDPNQAAPAIILISDGEPTDDFEDRFRAALEKKVGAERQGLFNRSLRTAIGLGLGEDDKGRRGRDMLKSFGRLSKSLRQKGLQTYYDVDDNNLDQLGTIIMSLTQGLSEEVDGDSDWGNPG